MGIRGKPRVSRWMWSSASTLPRGKINADVFTGLHDPDTENTELMLRLNVQSEQVQGAQTQHMARVKTGNQHPGNRVISDRELTPHTKILSICSFQNKRISRNGTRRTNMPASSLRLSETPG